MAGVEVVRVFERLHILWSRQGHHRTVMPTGPTHRITCQDVIRHRRAAFGHVVIQAHRAVSVEGRAGQTVFGRLDLRQCAAEGVAGYGHVIFGYTSCGGLGEHLRRERIGGGFLRIDGVAHHRGIDGDVLEGGERMARFFRFGLAGK